MEELLPPLHERRRRARAALGIGVTDGVVAANLNQFYKLEPRVFDGWLSALGDAANVRSLGRSWLLRPLPAVAALRLTEHARNM